MKILIINPAWKDSSLWGIRTFRFPHLAPYIIAANCPSHWNVTLIDESIEQIDFEAEVDLVAITSMTALSKRAYEIADEFRRRGKKVIIGGMHASALPDEVLMHADMVAVGEVESVWDDIVRDVESGELRRIYKSSEYPSLSGLKLPRRDLVKSSKYTMQNIVQTSRGCPYGCEFCAVTDFFGRKYRYRPINEVLAEIRQLMGKTVFFIDDNIIGNVQHAKEFFNALIPLKIKWISQGSINFGLDMELLDLAARSGCMGMFIGFESLSQESIELAGKRQNKIEEYAKAISNIHSYGIGIEAAFVFGLDGDDVRCFEKTLKFCIDAKIEVAQFSILTPFPGTRLFNRLSQENRIVHTRWEEYDCTNVVYKPQNMSADELKSGFMWVYREFYSYQSIIKRLLPNRNHLPLFLPLNLGFRKAYSLLEQEIEKEEKGACFNEKLTVMVGNKLIKLDCSINSNNLDYCRECKSCVLSELIELLEHYKFNVWIDIYNEGLQKLVQRSRKKVIIAISDVSDVASAISADSAKTVYGIPMPDDGIENMNIADIRREINAFLISKMQ